MVHYNTISTLLQSPNATTPNEAISQRSFWLNLTDELMKVVSEGKFESKSYKCEHLGT
jgi:hypothetical protein